MSHRIARSGNAETRKALLDQGSKHGKGITVTIATGFIIDAQHRVITVSITRGQPQHQSTFTELIEGRRLLGQIHRITGRQHNTRGAQDNAAGGGGQVTDVDQRLKDLRHIAIIRVVERYVAHP